MEFSILGGGVYPISITFFPRKLENDQNGLIHPENFNFSLIWYKSQMLVKLLTSTFLSEWQQWPLGPGVHGSVLPQDQGVVGATQLLYWQAQRPRVQATKTIPYHTVQAITRMHRVQL